MIIDLLVDIIKYIKTIFGLLEIIEMMLKKRSCSEQRLMAALSEELKNNYPEKISVVALTERAGVSRAMFYKKFGNIEKLYLDYCEEHLSPLRKLAEMKTSLNEYMYGFATVIETEREEYRSLIDEEKNSYFYNSFRDIFISILICNFGNSYPSYIYEIIATAGVELFHVLLEREIVLNGMEFRAIVEEWSVPIYNSLERSREIYYE